MARYDYKCDACGYEEEVQHSMHVENKIHCPVCPAETAPLMRLVAMLPQSRETVHGLTKLRFNVPRI
jgi:putative FmdB family regulatory protein